MQDPNQMISQKMIFDEVALGLRLRGYDDETIRTKVYDTLKVCGLYPYRNWPICSYPSVRKSESQLLQF